MSTSMRFNVSILQSVCVILLVVVVVVETNIASFSGQDHYI